MQLLVRETNTKVVSFYVHLLGFEVAPRVVMSRWLGKYCRSMAVMRLLETFGLYGRDGP